jgi:D-alanine-D-alanine ligase
MPAMHVGVTYDLKEEYLALGYTSEQVAEFDRGDTIDAIVASIQNLGHTVSRIGRAASLMSHLARGERWDLVFNIAEGLSGSARESQVPAILDVVGIPYTFSDPLVLSVCLDKRLAKHVVLERGLRTPAFFVVSEPADLSRIELDFPLFAKPLAEGTSRGVSAASRIKNHAELTAVCTRLLEYHQQPVIVERYLPGREFTVGILGTGANARSLGALEIHLHGHDDDVYSYDNKQLFEGRVDYTIAEDPVAKAAEELALAAYRTLGCRDGGRVDVRCDERGEPAFIEANPLAGLNPEISDLAILARLRGLSYDSIIGVIVQSASTRVKTGT